MTSPPAPLAARKLMAFIAAVTFLDALGVGLILPVIPQLIGDLSDLPNHRAVVVSGMLLFTYSAAQFFFAPLLGAASDRFGRRPILLLALLGFSLDYFIMAAAPTLAFLFVARLISGVCGATWPTANAAIADISEPDARARRFGMTGAAVGAGFIFGPSIGGLLGEADARLPFIAAGVLTGAAAIYGYFAFPETLSPDKRRAFDWRRANPVGAFLSILKQPGVRLLLLALFAIQLASQSYTSIWAFYTIAVAGWTPLAIGLSAGLYGVMMVLVQGVLTAPVVARFGEWRAVAFGLVMGVAGYFGLAVAQNGAMILAFVVFGGLGGFVFPAMQSLMTRAVAEDAQGELQGAVASSYSLSAIIGPILMTTLFAKFSGAAPYFPGAAFALGGALVAAGAGILFTDFKNCRVSASGV